ncbi:MAG TPA: glycosyltransferase [Acidimicrobiales bacterium]
MESLAPPVVAVIVAHDPGPWFEETLASLGSQSYEELSILVLDAASAEDLTVRVAGVLPDAYVRRFSQNRGFGATANEVTSMVDGAAYYLICHDDVALAPDAVQFLVEEAFRSNAGIVSPKLVSWDDPGRLLEVGMTVDKGGSVVGRVQPQEIDHGQHDSVRDVFVAPGGCALIRADLFGELGGFDPAIVAMGEDLDFCWRAKVAGARIIVAPDARVRHREGLASGERPLEPSLVDRVGSIADAVGALTAPEPPGELLADSVGEMPASTPPRRLRASRRRGKAAVAPADAPVAAPTTLQELQRRHELLAVFKCYGRFSLLRIVPQIVFLALGEVVVAELAGNRVRARSVVRAWRWNLGRLGIIRGQRKELQGHRRLSDSEIRLQQVGGSARLSAYARRLFQHGFHGAHADELAAAAAFDVHENDAHGSLAELPRVVDDGDGVSPTEQGRVSGRGIVTGWVVAVIVVLIGSRGLITSGIPAIGQFAPLPGWSGVFHQFAAGWHPSGVGTTAPASPAFALLGLLGTVLLGAMGLTLKVAIFACLPLGAWGAVRLMRPFGSQRAGMVAGIAYLAVPLPYNDLALGRWGALIVYAGAPWVLTLLFRATALAPFTRSAAGRIAAPDRGATGTGQGAKPRPRILRRMLTLGVLEAVLVSFVPSAAFVVLGVAVAFLVSAALLGAWQPSIRALVTAVGATVVAGILCLPWLIGTLNAGRGAINVLGVAGAPSTAPSWGDLLRFALGPIGVSPLAWGFTVAALLPLLIGRGDRFRWATRCWSIAMVFWLLAWVIGRGWAGSLAIDPMVLLAPAAAAIVTAIGLGIAAFEEDLRSATFGWKQAATGIAAIVVVLGRSPPSSRPCPAGGICPPPIRPRPSDGCTPRCPREPSGCCGSATHAHSTRAAGRRATGWPMPPRRTGRPTPPGCGTRPTRGQQAPWAAPSTRPARARPTDSDSSWPQPASATWPWSPPSPRTSLACRRPSHIPSLVTWTRPWPNSSISTRSFRKRGSRCTRTPTGSPCGPNVRPRRPTARLPSRPHCPLRWIWHRGHRSCPASAPCCPVPPRPRPIRGPWCPAPSWLRWPLPVDGS